MSAISFVMEKVRHGSSLDSGELKLLADEIERLHSKIEALAQELDRVSTASAQAHVADKARAKKLADAEAENARLLEALAHARRARRTADEAYESKVEFLEGVLRDVAYGLRWQPEISREELAGVIERIPITPHPRPEGS